MLSNQTPDPERGMSCEAARPVAGGGCKLSGIKNILSESITGEFCSLCAEALNGG